MTDFGSRLKRARQSLKITQKQLAERLGVEQSAISNYETNFRIPPTATLVALSEVLKVNLTFLITGDDLKETMISSETSNEVSDFISKFPVYKVDLDLSELQSEFMDRLLDKQFSEAFAQLKASTEGQISIIELYESIFEPTLKRIGDLWEQGKMSIAEEHIISDLIDRTMVSFEGSEAGTEKLSKPYKAAFMLPGSEMHHFPLKITAEIFKSWGWSTYYIGPSIPFFSLEAFLKDNDMDVLVLSVTLEEHLNSCESLIRMIKQLDLARQPILLVGGNGIRNAKVAIVDLGADLYSDSLQSLKGQRESIEERVALARG